MAQVIEAIGLISGVLGIISFAQDNFPEQESVGSTVRVTVGLDTSGGLNNAGGDAPDIRLFNEAGEFLGMKADPGSVSDGGFLDITVDHNDDDNSQATYALFSANNDAVCIAYTTITWPSGDQYTWMGDWGHQCGGSWYYSNVYVSGSDAKPDCLWIDANNDQPQTGFQVHWPTFSADDTSIPDDDAGKQDFIDSVCSGGPSFKMSMYPDTDPNSITYTIPSNDGKRSIATASYRQPLHVRRASRLRSSAFAARSNGTATGTSNPHAGSLVIDNDAAHAAQALCESETSVGPSFVNVAEGNFCRMTDKTLWPVCGDGVADNCFNTDSQKLIQNGVASRDESYTRVLDWTTTN
ncbi:hypothetical protein F5Y15DRAFT_255325 [Xylariaceae sp. FL0016]|nr:hypothetical protein F5Y15DRAFT_255325 [Xylariaceae sp. FL0016]